MLMWASMRDACLDAVVAARVPEPAHNRRSQQQQAVHDTWVLILGYCEQASACAIEASVDRMRARCQMRRRPREQTLAHARARWFMCARAWSGVSAVGRVGRCYLGSMRAGSCAGVLSRIETHARGACARTMRRRGRRIAVATAEARACGAARTPRQSRTCTPLRRANVPRRRRCRREAAACLRRRRRARHETRA
eukprot:6202434-Pleurochrysis_carterae.AAC.1